MKYLINICLWLIIVKTKLFAQDSLDHKPVHSLYSEFGGSTFIGYSLNYEIRLQQIAFRVGSGKSGFYDSKSAYAVPCEIVILPNNKSNMFEWGVAFTPYFDKSFHYNQENFWSLRAGYRAQPLTSHFILRADLMLHYYPDKNSYYPIFIWAGLCLGYTFRKLN